MRDPLGGAAVDGEDPVSLLDPAVLVSQTSKDHFVNLQQMD